MNDHRHLPRADRILDSAGGLSYTRPRLGPRHSNLGGREKIIFKGAQLILWNASKRIEYNLGPEITLRLANGESRGAFETLSLSKRHVAQFGRSRNRAESAYKTNGVVVGTESTGSASCFQTLHFRSASIQNGRVDALTIRSQSACSAFKAF
ncbi:hypothetical protein [Rhizobium sp. 11515TR]|uniref:hypothetical protein n=1 Tax=Rhizobium sp. 11515TR TaxID=2028343 RepID=UPI0011B53968|nr:hypothetical protein [Rhizobium sp. 11515TR]